MKYLELLTFLQGKLLKNETFMFFLKDKKRTHNEYVYHIINVPNDDCHALAKRVKWQFCKFFIRVADTLSCDDYFTINEFTVKHKVIFERNSKIAFSSGLEAIN